MRSRPVGGPIQLEVRTWRTEDRRGDVAFHRSLVYRGTTTEVDKKTVLALHERTLATGYFVKARMACLDDCRVRGLPYGGVVLAVDLGEGTVTVGGDYPTAEAKLARADFKSIYEVD